MDLRIVNIIWFYYWIFLKPAVLGFVFPNMHIRYGERQSASINTPLKCLGQCSIKGRPQCVGFDFDRDHKRCYLHSSGTECGLFVRSNCCDHYRFYDCKMATTTPVVTPPPAVAPSLSGIPTYQGVNIPGGSWQSSLTTLDNCYRVCYFSPTCQSFDWNYLQRRCFLHRATTACNNLENLPFTTHYRIRASCNSVPSNCFNVVFQELNERSRSNGRQIAGRINYKDCVELCRTRTGCQAVDWDIKLQTCFEHNTAGIPLGNRCCRHARKLCNDGTTQLPLVTTTRATTTTAMGSSTRPPMVTPAVKRIQDDGKCPSELLAVDNTRSNNGIDVPGITDPDSCKEWCLANSSCAAVDFDNVATTGTRCYYHLNGVYDKTTALPDGCCTQFRRLPPCQNKRCWSMPSMEVTMERTISGVTLYQPIEEFLDLDPTMNYTDITLDECTGLCRMQADFTRNQNTGVLSGFFPIEAERSCYPAGNPIANSHKNCEVTVEDSDGTYENVSLVCYCSADQCNAFWAQVVEACVAHYPLDCHTLDLTFGQRHGEGFNMHFSGEDQAKNWSAVFNGSSYIQVDSFMNNVLAAVGPSATDNIRPDFSLLFWFKFTSPEASNMTILSNGLHDHASLDIFTSPLNATHRTIHATVRINMMAFSGSVDAVYDKWQYFFLRIVPIADYELLLEVGDDINMATDSDQVPTSISPLMTGASIDLRSNPLCIGKQYVPDTNFITTNIPGEFYVGLLDEIWMFRRGLKDTELQSLIQASYYPMRMNA